MSLAGIARRAGVVAVRAALERAGISGDQVDALIMERRAGGGREEIAAAAPGRRRSAAAALCGGGALRRRPGRRARPPRTWPVTGGGRHMAAELLFFGPVER